MHRYRNSKHNVKHEKRMVWFNVSVAFFALLTMFVPGQAHADGGTWTTLASTPATLALSGSGGVINGRFYVLMLDAENSWMNPLVVYDPTTNTSTIKATLPQLMGETGAAVINGKLYVAGGCINTDCRIGTTNTLYVYDSANDTWAAKRPMRTIRAEPMVGAIDGKLYVAGGRSSDTNALSTLEVYDPITDTWTMKAPMPSPVRSATAGVLNNKLYVAGGLGPYPFPVYSTLYVYDPLTDSWATKAPMPVPTYLGAGAFLNGIFYYAGGAVASKEGTAFNSEVVNAVYAYDPATDAWTTVTPMPATALFGVAASINGVLYVAGLYSATSSPVPILAFHPSTSPVANAGADQTTHNGNIVTLDGSGSSDSNGYLPLTHAWSFVSRPAGSTATFSDPTLVNPIFTADQQGDYVVQLVVTNSQGVQSSPATVTISTYNTPPVADPGPDQAVTPIGTTVQLDGTHSFDVDGDALTYTWVIISKPENSNSALDGADTSTPTFVADVHGTYTIQLVVSDPWIESSSKIATVSFTNIKPVANAGTSQSVVVGETVNLNGGGSSDANRDPLTYKWSLTSPGGSNSLIADPNSAATTFVPDLQGTYVVQLIVNDGFMDSDPSTIQVQVVTWKTVIIESVQQVETAVVSVDITVLKHVNMQNTLINKLNAAIANIEAGNYADALGQLQNDILAKTDGCAKSGMPDKNDWITNCAAQSEVYPLIMEAITMMRRL